MVACNSHNILLANESSTSQTIKVLNNLSLISSTPIKINIDTLKSKFSEGFWNVSDKTTGSTLILFSVLLI